MATPRRLHSAPITEALIDFRVKARRGFDASEFLVLKAELQGQYPIVEERRGQETRFEVQGGTSPHLQTIDRGVVAIFFSTSDRREVVQYRVDGFTLNRLRPYSSFDDIAPRAIRLWAHYARIARPEFIATTALRYINHIPVPRGNFEITDYLLAGPTVPPDLPQTVARFQSQVTFRDDMSPASAHVSQALEFDPTTEELRVVFDINAYVSAASSSETDVPLEARLEEHRRLKNRIFFGSLTDKALEPFDA